MLCTFAKVIILHFWYCMLNREVFAIEEFNPRDYNGDPRVAFDLVRKGSKYECTLCGHRFDYSARAVLQLKGVYLKKAAHISAMKVKLGISTRDSRRQTQINSFFTRAKNPGSHSMSQTRR